MADTKIKQAKRPKKLNFDKWGYVFIAPFFVVFTVFSLIPLISTFSNSFYENY